MVVKGIRCMRTQRSLDIGAVPVYRMAYHRSLFDLSIRIRYEAD